MDRLDPHSKAYVVPKKQKREMTILNLHSLHNMLHPLSTSKIW